MFYYIFSIISLYLSIIVLFCSCGNSGLNTITMVSINVPEQIQPYVNTFKNFHPINNPIQWKFDNLPSPVIGRCTLDSISLIELDITYWSSADNTQKEETILHELGHCVLLRGHLNTLNSLGQQLSIMNAYLLNETQYVFNRDNYLYELFNFVNVPMIGVMLLAQKVWDN